VLRALLDLLDFICVKLHPADIYRVYVALRDRGHVDMIIDGIGGQECISFVGLPRKTDFGLIRVFVNHGSVDYHFYRDRGELFDDRFVDIERAKREGRLLRPPDAIYIY